MKKVAKKKATKKVVKKAAPRRKRITKLVIDRSRWGQRKLLNPDGTMCCLGFLAEACGVPPNAMLNVTMPSGLDIEYRSKMPKWTVQDEPPIRKFGPKSNQVTCVDAAASVNDKAGWASVHHPQYIRTPAIRERTIKQIFAKEGIKVTFVDGPKPTTGRKKAVDE